MRFTFARIAALTLLALSVSDLKGQCTYSLTPTLAGALRSGDFVRLILSTQDGCAWTATTNAAFVTITPQSGTGGAVLGVAVAANPAGSPARSATITVSGSTATITQTAGHQCGYTWAMTTPSSGQFPASGGSGVFTVGTAEWPSECPSFEVTEVSSYVHITQRVPNYWGQEIHFTMDPNPTAAAREGNFYVRALQPYPCDTSCLSQPYSDTVPASCDPSCLNRTVSVTQAASAACTMTITPQSVTVPASGGSGTIQVSNPNRCTWGPISNSAFVLVNIVVIGIYDGTVYYDVTSNPGPPRTGTINVGGGQTFTVNQLGGTVCTIAIAPTSSSVPATGGSGSVQVTAPLGCTWTATSNSSFITITGGASGSGNGTVSYDVAGNAGPPRSGTMTIAGATFTVTQPSRVMPPAAAFSFFPTTPVVREQVQFNDMSTGNPTEWQWMFGDGTSAFGPNVSKAFAAAGVYNVSLMVANSAGSSTQSASVTVIAPATAPSAQFSWTPRPAVAGERIVFVAETAGNPVTWSWEFADVVTSTEKTPSIVFSKPGVYRVTLTVTNEAGSRATTQMVAVASPDSLPRRRSVHH
jgi:PKD repeat protein